MQVLLSVGPHATFDGHSSYCFIRWEGLSRRVVAIEIVSVIEMGACPRHVFLGSDMRQTGSIATRAIDRLLKYIRSTFMRFMNQAQ